MTPVVRKLVEEALGTAKDNLYRAQAAARGRKPDVAYGTSGQTLDQIIQGYQAEVKKWEAELQPSKPPTRGNTRG